MQFGTLVWAHLLLTIQGIWINEENFRICVVDNLGYTAADVALSLNNEGCYRAIRDAGLRSGTILHSL